MIYTETHVAESQHLLNILLSSPIANSLEHIAKDAHSHYLLTADISSNEWKGYQMTRGHPFSPNSWAFLLDVIPQPKEKLKARSKKKGCLPPLHESLKVMYNKIRKLDAVIIQETKDIFIG